VLTYTRPNLCINKMVFEFNIEYFVTLFPRTISQAKLLLFSYDFISAHLRKAGHLGIEI